MSPISTNTRTFPAMVRESRGYRVPAQRQAARIDLRTNSSPRKPPAYDIDPRIRSCSAPRLSVRTRPPRATPRPKSQAERYLLHARRDAADRQRDWMEWQAGYASGAVLMPKSYVTNAVAEVQ